MWKWIKRRESAVRDIAKADALAAKRQTDTVPGKAGEVPGEYLTLHHYLMNRYADVVLLTFDQIEGLLGFGLPECAWTQQEWWTGTDRDRDVRLGTSARTAYLLGVVRFARQLSERIARVLEELHLRQVGAQRVGGSRHCRNRGVTGLLGGMARLFGRVARFFGCMARFFGSLPKRFPLLSDRLELTPNALTYFPRLLGQHAEVFSRRPGRFRLDAALFDTAARLLDVLSLVLRQFTRAFGLVATLFRKSFGHLSFPHCAEKPPDDNGRFLTTMTDGRGACLSG